MVDSSAEYSHPIVTDLLATDCFADYEQCRSSTLLPVKSEYLSCEGFT